MTGRKCNISLIIVLSSLFSYQAYSQQINYRDSLPQFNSEKTDLKPRVHYSIGSTLTVVPHIGSVAGFTISPSLSIPLSTKLSVDGGVIAGHYYSALRNFNPEGIMSGTFNTLSVFGSASYHFNSQLTIYGIGIKQLIGTSPISFLPKSSYTIGSSYNFGNFSIGAALQMNKWNNISSPMLFNGSQGSYSPYMW